MTAPPPDLRPTPPSVRRVSTNAVKVAAAGFVGLGLLVSSVLSWRRTETPTPAAAPEAAAPRRPTFLDQPAPEAAPSRAASPATPALADTALTGRTLPVGSGAGPGTPPPYAAGAPVSASLASAPTAPRLSEREQAYRAALGRAATAPQPTASAANAANAQQAAMLEAFQALAGAAGAQTTPPASVVRPQTSAGAPAQDSAVVSARVDLRPAGSPFTLRAGTVIPALLITGLQSDLAGQVLAQVSRNVYDSETQRRLLVPAGARLVGSYEGNTGEGQSRLTVTWSRLLFPDGQSVSLAALASYDPQGQAGVEDRVETHRTGVYGRAVALSLLTAAVQLSQPRTGATIYTPPTAGQVAAGAVGQELGQVSAEMIRRGMDRPPTVIVRQGMPFHVALSTDLVFPGAYRETGMR